jgi:hypothetical protein
VHLPGDARWADHQLVDRPDHGRPASCDPGWSASLHSGQRRHGGGPGVLRVRLLLIRLLIWNVFDSKTTIDELRESLPELVAPSRWIWNEAAERFGALVYGEELPEATGWAQDLVGAEPVVYEEFDST